ncbi:uncharacterized protein LOC131849928 [Achroia grisella]|uniref:uncharacterized protein LOC131849928 n=1 Tax=Achroia grisella TaxID=688607 RepID=UPI0027D23CF1|nr:uncharacterized protein LOC131849928 [Achroia grisella]
MSCIVQGCKTVWHPQSSIILHNFPPEQKLRDLWLSKLQIKGKYYNSARVCSLHFKQSDYYPDNLRRLRKSAVPYSTYQNCKLCNQMNANSKCSHNEQFTMDDDDDHTMESIPESDPYNDMADSPSGIEFLDEDADIVQQCVQNTTAPEDPEQYLVERKPVRSKQKRKLQEEDSDYDPRDDASSPDLSVKKKKNIKKMPKYSSTPTNTVSKASRTLTPTNPPRRLTQPNPSAQNKPSKSKIKIKEVSPKNRNVRIPDFEDPLCLPVRAIKKSENDAKKLKSWNNACLEHFKHSDNVLKPERGVTKSSTRSIVLRNIVNKATGKYETAIWSKTSVENEDGVKKSQIFQSILPRYREKKRIDTYDLQPNKKPKSYRHTFEVLITKEDNKDGDSLVVYKPKESISSVYKLIDTDDADNQINSENEDDRRYLKQVAHCKMCAPCYQASWRGTKKNIKKEVRCGVCARGCPSAYSLLTHVRTHPAPALRPRRARVAAELAQILEYHYKCRICQKMCSSIKSLRAHIAAHKGTEKFVCEICNKISS